MREAPGVSRVFVDRFDNTNLRGKVRQALRFLELQSIIRPTSRIFIKPNLTWRVPTPGVTVRPEFIRALVEELLPYSPDITIGESEGGQACFQAEDAFESHGLYQLAKDYGIAVVNLTKCPHEPVTTTVAGREVKLELASLLLHRTDVFITLPVPKVHALTGVSLGFKNQWGCLGDKMRVTHHPRFCPVVLAINKVLNPSLCIFDGTYFLDHTGPLNGHAIPMHLIVAGTGVGAATRVCCEIMRINPTSIAHLRLAMQEGMLPASLEDIVLNADPASFSAHQFRLQRAPINYIHLAAFHNQLLNRLFYDSKFADGLHEVLWAIRKQPLVRQLLYGKYGPGEAKRGG